MATRPGRDGGSAHSHTPGRQAEAAKQNDGAETRRVPSAHATRLIASAAPLPPELLPPPSSLLLLLESRGALAPDGDPECGSRATRRSFPSPAGGRPRRGSKTGRPRNGRPR